MEIQTTETSENSASLAVTSTETTVTTETNESLDQITPPVTAQPQPTDTSEQPPPPPVTTTEPPPPEVTNTQTPETLVDPTPSPEITSTHATEPSDDSTTLPPVTTTQTTQPLEQSTESTLPPLTDSKSTETIDQSAMMPPVDTDNSQHDNIIPSENHQVMEMRQETVEEGEEVRSVLKVIAATGKFCLDWEKLRSMLSLHLKQVISEYPQAKMTIEEQKVSLGETSAELAKRLDDALHSFVDGPPFTIQRLSEIILDARSLYPNLSKLALALEKNLSVTSTLTMLTNTYPPSPSFIPTTNGVDQITEDPNPNPNPNSNQSPKVETDAVMENGGEAVADVSDVIMTEVEGDVSDVVMTMDMETSEKLSEEPSPMMTTGES